jgi:hypothetical protein
MIKILNGGVFKDYDEGLQYDGGKTEGQFDSWYTMSTNPNEFVKTTYGELSKRNITLYHTFAGARACVNKPLTYILGEGLRFKSMVDNEFLGWPKKKAVKWSKKFTKLLHYSKKAMGYYDKQLVIAREALICGDALVHLLREDDSGRFDIIVSGGHIIDWESEKNDDKNTILGVKMDKYSRKEGYYKKDGSYVPFKDENGHLNAIQFMFPETAGQVRGNGCFYSEIAHAKNFDRVWDATIARMVQESILLGWFKASNTDIAKEMDLLKKKTKGQTDPRTTTTSTALTQIARNDQLAPGSMFHLQNEEDMGFNDLKTPSNNFGMANDYFFLMFAMARGYPPAFIKGMYDVSYSAGRAAFNDVMRKIMMERAMFIRQVDTPINYELLKYYVSMGQLEAPPDFQKNEILKHALLEGVHIGPTQGAINPSQEADAAIKLINHGLAQRSSKALELSGMDWDNSKDEYAIEEDEHYNASGDVKLKLAQKGIDRDNPTAAAADTEENPDDN